MTQGVLDAELAVDNRPGLIRSANVVTQGSDVEGGTRWITGFTFDADPCGGSHIIDPCQLGSGADPADTTTCIAVGPIQPYIVAATEKHSTFDNRPQYYRDRALRKLLGSQSKGIEAEFWAGTKATARTWSNNQYLANPTGLTILQSGAALGIIDGLAALEQAIADGSTWERGAIHATPRLVTHWISQQLVHAIPNPRGGTLLTEMGTVVIAGSGYPGTGPGGAGGVNLNHLQWAYATPLPQVRLGEITYNETDTDLVAVDRSTNDRTVRAQRFAAVTFAPCFRAAALVNMTSALAVPGS